ncbi:Phenylalanyl-tRNA synthetase, beta subunit, cytoplasmic [Sorochytrium milnesiophthora]
MADLTTLVLQQLDKQGCIEDTGSLKTADGVETDQAVLLGILNSLVSREMVSYMPLEAEKWVLTEEGRDIAANGSHEAKVFNAIPAGQEGLSIADLSARVGAESAKIGQGKAFKSKWIGKAATGNLIRLVDSIVDTTKDDLCQIRDTATHKDAKVLTDLKKRKLCDKQKVTTFKVSKGPQFQLTVTKQATDITVEMLQSGLWRNQSFKKYNFDAEGIEPVGGHLHPLMKVREEFRQIFFEMGFTEMPTNQYVESSFWNFDALFQPQQHPARDMHDTFFLKDPATDNKYPRDVMEKVKEVHSKGGYGSIGHGYDWKEEEAEKLLLRTHTTAISSNMLYKLAHQEGGFKPAKYFSIDRVFRNETVDATHLAEFHQIEGVIADYNLSLGDLIGFMDVFFKKMGVGHIHFKPTYNPYTEPSMEIFSYHSGLQRYVEIGNSGCFRPEMLLPLGLPKGVRVIAWGLSLERPTMIKYGIDNIRDLLGHKVDLGMIAQNPICRFDKKMGKELATADKTNEQDSQHASHSHKEVIH